jgi:hypothetical protein
MAVRIDIAEILQHPGQHYPNPRELLKDDRLTARQKLKILDAWADEQKQRLEAGNENMLPAGPASPPKDDGSTLQEISAAKTTLQ